MPSTLSNAPVTEPPLPLIRLINVSKTFPGVNALTNVDFDVRPGEVHILFGENGAGKSTLINIMSGALTPDSGTIELNGKPIQAPRSVYEGRRLGVAAMFQEFSLAADLSVEENILLNAEPVHGRFFLNKSAAREQVADLMRRTHFTIDPKRTIRELSRAEQQMVELCKALATNPRVLILDEPTASLSDQDAEQLFRLIAGLKASGVGIVYITHRIAEIHRIGDRITVLRDGRRVDTILPGDASREKLVEMMTGKRIGQLFPSISHHPGENRLVVQSLRSAGGNLRNVNFAVRAGEVVGLAGLVGCGKSDIARACFGLVPLAEGKILVSGKEILHPSPHQMLSDGVCYIPSDRRREGLMLQRPARENLTLTALDLPQLSRGGFLRLGNERKLAQKVAEDIHLRPVRLESDAGTYSGGNQQKIVLARALSREMKVCIFDEPTVGIDVGARRQIYDILNQLVKNGMAVLLVSSDLTEITNLCSIVHVVREGQIAATFEGASITERNIVDAYFVH